jgi:hypothetical protein
MSVMGDAWSKNPKGEGRCPMGEAVRGLHLDFTCIHLDSLGLAWIHFAFTLISPGSLA